MSWEIATKGKDNTDSLNSNSNRTLSPTVSDRTRLQALAPPNDCYKYKMDLATNGVVITDAIKYVQKKKEELSKVKGSGSRKNFDNRTSFSGTRNNVH